MNMKKATVFLVLLVGLSGLAFGQSYQQQAVDALYEYAEETIDFTWREWRDDYNIRDVDEGSWQTVRLDVGQDYTFRRTLYEGNEYIILAAGDRDVEDLDLYVYDENWNEIGVDISVGPRAAVGEFSPAWTGTYYIVVDLYRGSQPWSIVGNILLWSDED